MGTSDKIKAILALNSKKIAELAAYFGMTRQSMSNKMLRDSWSAEDLTKVAAFVNCDFYFEMKDGQRIYLFSQADKDRFGPAVPRIEDTTQINGDAFIDARGNTFTKSEIAINEVMGGGFERVGADQFDDPKGLKEDARRFRKLDKRMEEIRQRKLKSGGYEKNEYGGVVVPALSEVDKPDDVNEDEWREYLKWIRQ